MSVLVLGLKHGILSACVRVQSKLTHVDSIPVKGVILLLWGSAGTYIYIYRGVGASDARAMQTAFVTAKLNVTLVIGVDENDATNKMRGGA